MMLTPARRESANDGPTSWQQLPHGIWMQQQLSHVFAPYSAKIFGYYLARVGHLAKELELPELRVRHQFSAAQHGESNILAELEYWPFAENALDAVVMIGQLEFERDPHQVLREMSRSLIADGYLLIAGFNPYSPSVVTGCWPGNTKQPPWSGRYFSKARITDWLSLLNFEIMDAGYVAPTLLIARTTRADFGLAGITRFIPQLNSMYYIVARKREFPLTVMRVKKRMKPQMNGLPIANRVK